MAGRVFGEIPGTQPGAVFSSRRELHESGIHRPLQAGISGAASEGADSIVVSGGYEDDEDWGTSLVYTGHGGNDASTGKQAADQELTAGNAALVVSQQRGYPVRVVRGAGGHPLYSPPDGYRYDGLYDVQRHWDEIGSSGFRIFRFELVRRPNQLAPSWAPSDSSGEHERSSGAHESVPIGPASQGSKGFLKGHIADVSAAFELVDEAALAVSRDVDAEAQEAISVGNYSRAREVLELAQRLASFRNRVGAESEEWDALRPVLLGEARPVRRRSKARKTRKTRPAPSQRSGYGKVSPEDKTSQSEFLVPILEALAELGGSARAADVLDIVYRQLSADFKPADFERLASRTIRWKSTAQWARQQLVNDGRLQPARERGVWELSDLGRTFLTERPTSESA